jgi:hypothetical protein
MNKRLKFHAIAITVICGLITLLYVIAGPSKQSEPTLAQGNYKITIISATWGYNCNPFIKETMEARKQSALTKDAEGKVIQDAPLKLVERDNVLKQVAASCNEKPYCEVAANTELFGFDPHEGCFKELEVSYRCYDIDRLRTLKAEQAALIKLDCTSIETSPDATKRAK